MRNRRAAKVGDQVGLVLTEVWTSVNDVDDLLAAGYGLAAMKLWQPGGGGTQCRTRRICIIQGGINDTAAATALCRESPETCGAESDPETWMRDVEKSVCYGRGKEDGGLGGTL